MAQYALSIKGLYDRGILKPQGRALENSSTRSKKAKKQGFGGYNEKAGRSKKYRVKDSFGTEIVLQSSFELKCSEILDQMEILWIRPKSLLYDGKRYFPDFYLVEHNIYLDPKNNFLAKKDLEKIQKVIDQNDVKVYILTEDNITVEYIGSLVKQVITAVR